MKIEELKEILQQSGIKFAYRAWLAPVPKLPFGCFLTVDDSNFYADDSVYTDFTQWRVEYYSKTYDPEGEAQIKAALKQNGIAWALAGRTYLDSEKMHMTVFVFVE